MALDGQVDQTMSRRAMKAELLDAETERELALAWRDHRDQAALHRLINAYMRLAISVAARFRRYGAPMNDLIQEAGLGLMKAADKFDPDRGVRFSTYAVWWIRAYVGKYLKEARSTVRPQSGTVAQPDLSLDSSIDEEGDVTHLERIEDDGPGPEDMFLSDEGDRSVREALLKVRKRVGELGWDIVHSRLQQDTPRTLEEIGKRWGVSRERVRQVELKTKQFLNRYLEEVEREAAA